MIELLEHNKETYKRLCDVLEDNNKCALVQATGTGKSYIAGKYIEEYANKALILVPTNAIADAWSDLLRGAEKEVEIITYQAFAREPHNFFDYDLVIADEMHHLGSDVWGKKFVETYLQSENHKIIGLTATEIRYLDNSRDMAEEIFENIRVDGCDLPTAINTGVLPTFKYVSALYCDESDFDEWKEKAGKIKDIKTQTELKGRLDVCIKNMVSVKQAVNENLTDDYKKIIVFLNNVESKETALEMFRDVFRTANFYDVDYSKQRTANNEQINKFKADENRSVLFAVDMLNEGIHIKGTDCVIMFRKTVSPQVYLQQLGRGLASGTDKTPVIFDFVGNTNSITSKNIFYKNAVSDFIQYANGKIKNKERKIVIKTYAKNIFECLDSIVRLTVKKPYTEEEIEFIKNYFKILGAKDTAEKLGRTILSVKDKAHDLGILKKTDINQDILKIVEMVKEKGSRKTAEELGVTQARVNYILRNNGYGTKNKVNRYDNEEILKLIKQGFSVKSICEKIGCSQTLIRKIRTKNGINPMSLEQGKYFKAIKNTKIILLKYRNGETCAEIARQIGVSSESVARVLKRQGIVINRKNKAIPVVALTQNGQFYKKFDSIADAARFIKSKATEKNRAIQIGQSLLGKTKTSYGYKWLYEKDYKKMIAEQKAGDA